MIKLARLAGKGVEEIEDLLKREPRTFMEKAQVFLYKNLIQNKVKTFVVVFMMASIPNPLFDLAGLTCGHFLIPFSIFFGAAFIGKSLVKVNIQVLFRPIYLN